MLPSYKIHRMTKEKYKYLGIISSRRMKETETLIASVEENWVGAGGQGWEGGFLLYVSFELLTK